MEAMMPFLVLLAALIVLDVLSLLYAADSREGIAQGNPVRPLI